MPQKVLPSPCFLLVTYRFPTFQFSLLFSTSHTTFHFLVSRHQKSTAIAVITVLPGFNVFSNCKVYLELAVVSCFLNGNCNCYCSTNHWVITHTDFLLFFLIYYVILCSEMLIKQGLTRNGVCYFMLYYVYQ